MDIDVKNSNKRSTCLCCGRKKERKLMVKHGQHWTCKGCLAADINPVDVRNTGAGDQGVIKVLNLYAGIGGNRKLWPLNVHVTAVELNPKVAAAYQGMYPNDAVICADAHEYLVRYYYKFDFIWSSRPCITHTRMNFWTAPDKKRYADLSLYQEILFLRAFCKTKWCVENVDPYYLPLIPPDQKIGRHLFWSNFKISRVHVPQLRGFIGLDKLSDKKAITDWLGITLEKNIYLSSKKPIQVFRNCVHPLIGESIFNDAFNL